MEPLIYARIEACINIMKKSKAASIQANLASVVADTTPLVELYGEIFIPGIWAWYICPRYSDRPIAIMNLGGKITHFSIAELITALEAEIEMSDRPMAIQTVLAQFTHQEKTVNNTKVADAVESIRQAESRAEALAEEGVRWQEVYSWNPSWARKS